MDDNTAKVLMVAIPALFGAVPAYFSYRSIVAAREAKDAAEETKAVSIETKVAAVETGKQSKQNAAGIERLEWATRSMPAIPEPKE